MRPQQDLWGPIPQSNNLIRVGSIEIGYGSCQSKVSNFDFAYMITIFIPLKPRRIFAGFRSLWIKFLSWQAAIPERMACMIYFIFLGGMTSFRSIESMYNLRSLSRYSNIKQSLPCQITTFFNLHQIKLTRQYCDAPPPSEGKFLELQLRGSLSSPSRGQPSSWPLSHLYSYPCIYRRSQRIPSPQLTCLHSCPGCCFQSLSFKCLADQFLIMKYMTNRVIQAGGKAINFAISSPFVLYEGLCFVMFKNRRWKSHIFVNIRMNKYNHMNLNNLFKIASSPSPARSLLTSSTHNARSSPTTLKEDWNLRQLEEKMRKGVRKEVGASSLSEQLKIFYNMQKEVILSKILLILSITLPFFVVTSIQGSVLFTFLLLIASKLFCSLIIPLCDPVLIDNIRRIQPLIYCSIFYSVLKWGLGKSSEQISWPITAIAVLSTLAHCTLRFYESFLLLATRKIVANAIKQKHIIGKLINFPQYLIERGKMVVGISKYVILVVGISAFLLLPALVYFDKFTMDIFSPLTILLSFSLFIILEAYLDLINFINLTFTQNLKLATIIKDKIPIYLTLLRLQSKPFNRLVQLECSKCIFVKVSEVERFLSIETCKSLIYNTYMDIFNQYATIELERTNAAMVQFIRKAKANDSTISLQKNIFKDLFIHFRKAFALLSSEWAAAKVVQSLASLNYLLLTISKVSKDQEQEVRLSGRVVILVKNLAQNMNESSKRSSLSIYTRKELLILYEKLQSQLHIVRS